VRCAISQVALSRRKKFVFAILTVSVVLVGLELSARLALWHRSRQTIDPVKTATIDRFHPLRYELAPGARLPANGPIAWINSAGLRGRDLENPKKRLRVLCLGDSCTFGYAADVTDDLTYPAILGQLLEKSHEGQFEVLNGGRLSFCSLDVLNYYLYRGVEFEPDYVVFLAGWNDSHHCHNVIGPEQVPAQSVLEWSALYQVARQFGAKAGLPRPLTLQEERSLLKGLPKPRDGLSEPAFQRFGRLLEDFVRICRARRSVPILATYPSFARTDWSDLDSLSDEEFKLALPHLKGNHLSPKGWLTFITRTNAAIRSVAGKMSVPLVDGASISDPRLFVDLCHLNGHGNRAFAERVLEVIEHGPDERAACGPSPRPVFSRATCRDLTRSGSTRPRPGRTG
jgi:lysophospholipase L1-like esterase